jgi:hypothetical protein
VKAKAVIDLTPGDVTQWLLANKVSKSPANVLRS